MRDRPNRAKNLVHGGLEVGLPGEGGAEVMNPTLMRAVVLKTLSPQERAVFVKHLQAMAITEERGYGRTPRVELLSFIPENLGLTD